ncbi:cytochrome P450 family protein [Hyaloraphidium curvatum]|nr:cytochrome P450 family protein [Hyaloraphidium curvatum]
MGSAEEETAAEAVVFPGPPPTRIIGNLRDIDTNAPVWSLVRLAKQYGPIFKLKLKQDFIVISSQELCNELCDVTRFDKRVHPALHHVRNISQGLFTSETSDPEWGIAHRILMPMFGPNALKDMFPGMLDIAEQMFLKWEREGPDHVFEASDNFTRLTFDAIALCAFNLRLNSFYREGMHPFVNAMVRALQEAGARSRRMPIANRLMAMVSNQHEEDIRSMRMVAEDLIAERKANPGGKKDILSTMMTATDPKTGMRMSDNSVTSNLIAFLIAGHETTSGLLTFCMYELLRHPEVVAKARAEVDRVIGTAAPRHEHIAQLTYIDQVLKETLRLWPTAPAFSVYPTEGDTVIGGKWPVRKEGDVVYILSPALHRDPVVWGPDPEAFDPERFEFEAAQKLPPNCWKPFGNGQRACIGRPFALQEATLVVAMMLQRFEIEIADPDYKLDIKETLTMKPHGLMIKARRRDNVIAPAAPMPAAGAASEPSKAAAAPEAEPDGPPVHLLYGSNAGSAEDLARRIAGDAAGRGFRATCAPLDSAAGKLPKDGVVVVVTASYEGQPPDNARGFCGWLDKAGEGEVKGVKFAVFGTGNKDWARTYMAIPKLIDEKLEALGGERIMPRGEANARGDFFGDFDKWYANFWNEISAATGHAAQEIQSAAAALEVEFVPPSADPVTRQAGMPKATIVANRELVDLSDPSAPGARSKRHIEFALPAGMTYRTGDYLAVQPLNPPDLIDRALKRFGLGYDAQLVIKTTPGLATFLPTGKPVEAGELLSAFVELALPASRSQIERLAAGAQCPPDKDKLLALIADDDSYAATVLDPRTSVVDLLEEFASVDMPFGSFLQMLPPLKPRQYSISSSPLWSAEHCTLTVAVLRAPAKSGRGTYEGVASNYLLHARPGTKVPVSVRPSQQAFHPPESLETPMLMVCAGTGVAPFHGFVQDRAQRIAAMGDEVKKAGRALLFFGMTNPDADYLYKSEFAAWEELGIVSMRPAYSSKPEGGVKYVQDRLWQDREDVRELVKAGATLYLCGDGQRMAPAVHDVCVKIRMEGSGCSREEAEAWMEKAERLHGRYVADVFA